MKLRNIILGAFLTLSGGLSVCAEDGKPLTFAFVTDTHIALGSASERALSAVIKDINADDSLRFVIFGGDITDFGTKAEFRRFKASADSLNKEWYILAGNHDACWSASGCNDYPDVFGYETMDFTVGGWRFLGCNSGPDMRMAPALVPRETMNWLKDLKPGSKAVFVNHFPMDSSVLNYFDVTRELKRLDVRLEIGGHLHANKVRNYSGIPGIICRSSLAANGASGYTVFRLWDDHVEASERRIYLSGGSRTEINWYETPLKHVPDTVRYDSHGLPSDYPWMRYEVNDKYPQVREVWKIQDSANVVSGFAVKGGRAFYTLASYPSGGVHAVKISDGSFVWKRIVPGKLFSTPAVSGNSLVIPTYGGSLLSLKIRNGKMNIAASFVKDEGRIVYSVASPVVMDGVAYIGTSQGVFYAVRVRQKKILWKFEGVEGHMSSTPYVDNEQVVFGTWGRKLYSLDPKTGALQWVWTGPSSSRMISPANVVPVKADGKIFIAVPNRKVYALDAATGKELYVANGGRDAICLSEDGKTLYSKTMFHHVYALDTGAPSEKRLWEVEDSTGYDISPSALKEIAGTLLIPTDKGNIIALDSRNGDFLWAHKISTALVNPLSAWVKNDRIMILCSTMDGTVSLLSAPTNNR